MIANSVSKSLATLLLLSSITAAARAQVDVTSHREWAWLKMQRRALLDVVKDLSLAKPAPQR